MHCCCFKIFQCLRSAYHISREKSTAKEQSRAEMDSEPVKPAVATAAGSIGTPSGAQQEETPQLGVQKDEMTRINIAETVGGSTTRKYLNKNVTPYLLEGMRKVALEQPEEPLKVLGEYLLQQNEILKNK